MKAMKAIGVTALLILLALLSTLFLSASPTSAQAPNTSSIVASEFPTFEPELLADYPSLGYLTWNTSYGLYTMDKARFWFSFTDRYGVKQIEKAVFWLNTTDVIDIAKINNITVLVANDTTFQIQYSAVYKGGDLTKNTPIGIFTVTHKFFKEQYPKISVFFEKDEASWSQGGLGDFNIVWVLLPTKSFLKLNDFEAIDFKAKTSMDKIRETVENFDKRCEIGDSAHPFEWTGSWSLTLWDDVEGISVLYAGVEKVWGGKGITIAFPTNVGEVDPSTVGTTSTYGTRNAFQRKCFYANGRFWFSYSDGSNMVYRTSTDGTTWSAATTVRAGENYGELFSVWFDGARVHYSSINGSLGSGKAIVYRSGVPNADGTITWTAAEVVAVPGISGWTFYYPTITVDSNGYAWIGYQAMKYPYYHLNVTKSGNNDGTWGTTASGFPYAVYSDQTAGAVCPVPLTNGKMAVFYPVGTGTVRIKTWTGSVWRAEAATTSTIANYIYFCAVAEGDDGHLVFLSGTSIKYTKYTYSLNSFGSETTLASATTSSAPAISISGNRLYVFWAASNHIYYRKFSGASWGSTVDWIDESTEGFPYNNLLTGFYEDYGEYIGLGYQTKTSSPYNVKFAYLSTANIPPNAPTLNSPDANAHINPSASVQFTWTFNDSDEGDSQSAYQLQIGNSEFTVLYWDTGKTASTSSSTTITLPSNMTVGLYYWRVKTWDSAENEGNYSSGRAIIVDGLKVDACNVDFANMKVYVHMKYAYDNADVGNGNVSLAGLYALTNSTGWAIFNMSDAADFDYGPEAYGVIDSVHGLTHKMLNQTLPIAKRGSHLIESNANIYVLNWDGVELYIDFNVTISSYTLKVSGAKPVYVLGIPYNSTRDYTTFLSLSHDGRKAVTIGYPNWGDLWVETLSGNDYLSLVYWGEEQTLTLKINGEAGSRTLKLHCGGRGNPESISGLSNAVYDSHTTVLTGVYTLSSETTVTLSWAKSPGGTPGGVAPAPVTLMVYTVSLGQLSPGYTATFNITVEFQTSTVTITDVEFLGDKASWFNVKTELPQTFSTLGKALITVEASIPADAQPGDYTVQAVVHAVSQGQTVQNGAPITLTVAGEAAPPTPLTRILGNPAILLMLAVAVVWLSYYSLKKR